MGILKDRNFVILLLIGLLLRLILIPFPGFSVDMNDWAAWATRLNETGFKGFYSPEVFSDYPPGYLYVLRFLGYLQDIFKIDSYSFSILLKIPALLSEIIIAFLIYQQFSKSVSRKFLLIVVSLILFNPALLFSSSIWGQVDSVLSLFLLLSIIFLMKKKLTASSFLFGLALLIKPQALAIVPIFLLFLFKNFSFSNFLKLSLPAFFIIYVLSWPFFQSDVFFNLYQHISNSAKTYPYTSLFAYNLWGIIGFWISDQQIWKNLSYQNWGYILLAIYWIIISYFYFRNRLSLLSLSILSTLGFYFLLTRVHERYLYPSLILLILAVGSIKSKFLMLLTIILSIINLLNLYFVYVYYNEIYFKLPKLFYNDILYKSLENSHKTLSLVSVILFILITIVIIRTNYAKKVNY